MHHASSRGQAPPVWLYLIVAIAGWINRQQQHIIDYVLVENRVLYAMNREGRKQPNDRERRVLAVKAVTAGIKALRKLKTAFSPDTLLRWHRKLIAMKWTFPNKGAGRPRLPKATEDLIVRIALEVPGAGYTDILNRIRNVGITEDQASRSTIANILRRHGLEPAPGRRKGGNWWTFLKAHWQGLAAADFTTIEVAHLDRLVTYYGLFVMDLKTRTVHLAGLTTSPCADWVKQIARNLTDPCDGFLRHHTHLLLDRDSSFLPFAGVIGTGGITVVNTPPDSPNCNAFIERFFRSLKGECLDHRVFFSEADLRQTIVQYLEHYHTERVHQGIGHRIIRPGEDAGRKDGRIAIRERCGGILKYVHRVAA